MNKELTWKKKSVPAAAFSIAAVLAFAAVPCLAAEPANAADVISDAVSEVLNTLAEEQEPTKEQDELIRSALDVILDYWTDYYAESDIGDGYLGIKNTRIIYINDSIEAVDDIDVKLAEYAEAAFGDVDCIVEFVLFSDYYGGAPYYSNINLNDSVIVYKDGTMETGGRNILDLFRLKYYVMDFSGIIEDVYDAGSAYDAEYMLREE